MFNNKEESLDKEIFLNRLIDIIFAISIKNVEIYKLISSLDHYIDVKGEIVPTAGTDGSNDIVYNLNFCKNLTNKELMFILYHEVYHIILNHVNRCNLLEKDPIFWNAAGDYYINDKLIKNNIGSVPSGALYDSKYCGLDTNDIYDKLIKDKKNALLKIKFNFDTHFNPPPKDKEKYKNNSKDGMNSKEEQNENKSSEKTTKDLKNYISSKKPDITKKFKNISIEDIKNDIIKKEIELKKDKKLQKNFDKSFSLFGDLFKEYLEEIPLREPEIKWTSHLKKYILSNSKKIKFTYSKFNKKNYDKLIFQKQFFEEKSKSNALVAIDISSSIGPEELEKFITETYYLLKKFGINKLDIMFFNTSIVFRKLFILKTKSNLKKCLKELLTYNYSGGGTCVKCIMDIGKLKNPKDYFLIFTDLYFDFENILDIKNLVFISTCKENKSPYGKTLYFNNI